MRENSGVTLIQVIVAIIIIVIIASFAIWYSSKTSTEAKLARIYAEINAIRDAYQDTKILNEVNPGNYPLDSLLVTDTELNNEYDNEDIPFLALIADRSKLYLITPENAKVIDAEKVSMDYIIDGNTDNIYLIGGFARRDGQSPVYEYKDIVKLYNSTMM